MRGALGELSQRTLATGTRLWMRHPTEAWVLCEVIKNVIYSKFLFLNDIDIC